MAVMTLNMYETIPQVAKRLHISPSTLKKYYLLIESYDCYNFTRNQKGQVLFDQKDVDLIQRLIVLKQKPNVTLEQACQQVLSETGLWEKSSRKTDIGDSTNANITVLTDMTVITEQLSGLRQIIEEQHKQIQKLTGQIEQQNEQTKFLQANEKETEKDRHESLMQLIREVQEVKKELAASRDKKWWKFWK
jgi:hypothetical protein